LRIGIIGAGAIGCLFAARLKRAGNEVLLVHNDRKVVSQIRKNGIRVREQDGKTLRVAIPIVKGPANLRGVDLVLFTVKAYSTEEAAFQHRNKVRPGSTFLTLQNGLGNLETLGRFFGKGRVVAGSTTEASLLLRPGFVVHAGKGKTVIGEENGPLWGRASDVLRTLIVAGFNASLTRNVRGVIWSKAIINSAINPVSALTRLRNGELADAEGIRELMLDVIHEGLQVSRATRVNLEPKDVVRLLFRILHATALNQSSMLQDVERRRKTEIRQLNGAIVKYGQTMGVSTPNNALLTYLVLGLEKGQLRKRDIVDSVMASLRRSS
jgi:2-dehydropantoate 2-reductase